MEEKQTTITLYGGSVYRLNRNGVWHCCFQNEDGTQRRVAFPGNDGHAMAQKYQMEESDRSGLTRRYSFPIPCTKTQEYLSGFFDGDGCISVTSGGGLSVIIGQSSVDAKSPTILCELQKYFGGTVKMVSDWTPTEKPMYHLQISGALAHRLIEMVSNYGIVKRPQADLVMKSIVTERDSCGFQLKYDDSHALCADLKRAKKEYHSISIDISRITVPWIAGFADAEGSVRWANTTRFQWTQSSCPRLLTCMQRVIGGTVDKETVAVYGPSAIKWMRKLRPYLIVKKPQIELILAYHKIVEKRKKRGERKRSSEEVEKMKELRSQLALLKHGRHIPKKRKASPPESPSVSKRARNK